LKVNFSTDQPGFCDAAARDAVGKPLRDKICLFFQKVRFRSVIRGCIAVNLEAPVSANPSPVISAL